MYYPNSNRIIPENVCDAIAFTGKTGFISRHLWNERFNDGNKTWKAKQLSKLLTKDIFKSYIQICGHQFYKLGLSGQVLSKGLGIKPIQAPLNNQILHDEWIYETVLALHKANYVQAWLTEAELKSGVKFNSGSLVGIGSKFPDSVLQVSIKSEIRIIAVEYERTLKSVWRIKETLRTYSTAMQFPLVIIICNDEVIRKAYLKVLKQIGDENLNKKIGLAVANVANNSLSSWHSEPELREIQMIERTFCLKDILNPIHSKRTLA